MKASGRVACSMLFVAIALSLGGCSKSATNAMTESGKPTTSAVTSAFDAGKGLFNYLGGLPGVNRLAEAFGLNISKSPLLSKLFDAAALTATKLGLVNEIAKASGLAPPNAGVPDLLTTLSGRGLDQAGVAELNQALSSAADEVKMGEPEKTAMMALVTPITNSVATK